MQFGKDPLVEKKDISLKKKTALDQEDEGLFE